MLGAIWRFCSDREHKQTLWPLWRQGSVLAPWGGTRGLLWIGVAGGVELSSTRAGVVQNNPVDLLDALPPEYKVLTQCFRDFCFSHESSKCSLSFFLSHTLDQNREATNKTGLTSSLCVLACRLFLFLSHIIAMMNYGCCPQMTLKDSLPIKENSVFNYAPSSLTGEIIKTVMVIFFHCSCKEWGPELSSFKSYHKVSPMKITSLLKPRDSFRVRSSSKWKSFFLEQIIILSLDILMDQLIRFTKPVWMVCLPFGLIKFLSSTRWLNDPV